MAHCTVITEQVLDKLWIKNVENRLKTLHFSALYIQFLKTVCVGTVTFRIKAFVHYKVN